MRRRSGVALLAVMLFCFAAALVGTETFLLLEWAHASAASSRWRFAGRVQLASMVEVGRRWLKEELKMGRLPLPGGALPHDFSERRLFQEVGEGGAVVNVYDLDYSVEGVPVARWQEERSAESFFPPCRGAFLIRAIKPVESGPVMMLEVAVAVREVTLPDGGRTFVLEPAPLLWQEVWL